LSLNDFFPVKFYLPGWPTDIIGYPEQLDSVGIYNLSMPILSADALLASGTVQILQDITFDLPLISGLSVALLSHGDITEFGFEVELHEGVFSLSLFALSAAIRFESGLLKRMKPVAGGFVEESPDPITGEPQPIEISIEGADLSFNSAGEFTFSFAGGAPVFSIQPFMIGDSGIVVEVTSCQPILAAQAATLPPTIPADWRGIYLDQAAIHLPEGLNDILPDDITIEDFFIGSGGFCGKVTGNWTPDDPDNPFDEDSGDAFGFRFRTTNISIEFQQNTIVSGSIAGYLEVPFFDESVAVDVGLTNDGDFTIGLSDPDGLLTLEKDGIISIAITSLEFIKEADAYSVKLTGEVTPLLAGLAWPSFELKGLTISTDGTVKVDGGWIELPEQKALDFHGFKVEIAKLGFGSEELDGDLYKWIGFSGGIQIIQALPLRGGVEGLKVMWTEDGKVRLKIGGIYLQFEIKDVLTFDGSVYFIDEDEPEYIKEFRGGVHLSLIPVNLAVDAQFVTGKTAGYNYFYIAVGVDLPVGIPLGPPVLGLYGLAGLYGHNMSLDYQSLIDYDDVTDRPDLTDFGNWFNQLDAMAFGAGVTVGTLPDVKFTAKAKVLFVILLPGPVLLIEGHAGMLSLGESYPLRVLAVLDPTGTFLMNISASYRFPKTNGELLDVGGAAEAYFTAADSWHLYLGEDQPESKRIRADILSFFKAQTYLMVDDNGLLMGAWIGYGLDEKYGILRVILEAWMTGELVLSAMPLQAKGSVTLYGNAELRASIVSLGISVEANVTVEAPRPLGIFASLKVQLKTPLGKPKATIKLGWEKTGEPPFPIPLAISLGIEHRKVSKNWQVPKYSKYAVDDDGLYAGFEETPAAIPHVPVVPPDVYLVLNFDKAVIDSGPIGANPAAVNGYETVGDYEFKYELNAVTLQYREEWNETVDDENWTDYAPGDDPSDYSLTGYWQAIPDPDGIVNTKLILNASTPFGISRLLDENDRWFTLLDTYNPDYPCAGETQQEEMCAEFENRAIGEYQATLVQDEFIFTSPHPMIVQGYRAPWLGTDKALNNTDGYWTIECLNIKAQPASAEIALKVINEVIITAGIGYDSYLKLTDEYSNRDIELFISVSALDLGNGIIPAFISFPAVSFEGLPFQVWVTCIVNDPPDPFLYAFDEDGNVLDSKRSNQGIRVNGAMSYKLESDGDPIRRIGIRGAGIRIVEICYSVHHAVRSASILTTLPEDAVKTDVHLSKNSQGSIYVYDRENTQIRQIEFDIPEDLADDEVRPVTLDLAGQTFRAFLLTGRFKLIRACAITEEAAETFGYNGGLNTHLQDSLEENWGKHTAQILTPGKYYRLEIKTAASRRKNGGSWEKREFTEYLFFKTGNPPGPPASTQIEVEDAERYDLEEPLNSLVPYIGYTIPAGGAADEAQPHVYRSYDLGVVYNDSYIDQMYQMAALPIKIALLDNNDLPVVNAAGEELQFINLWGDNPKLSLTREETRYEDILNDSGCVVMTAVSSETNVESLASSRDLLLKPWIQYRARVMAGDTVVHEFAFSTSRYANFLHHVQSFQDAVWDHFTLLQDPGYEIDAAVLELILTNTEEESVQFEQLMALFDLNPRPLPERMEIALINDGRRSYGCLLESAEPLDWNRTELAVSFAELNDVVEEFAGVVKIIAGSVGSITMPREIVISRNNQWVDILVLETADLSNFSLDYLPASENTYREYYRFPANSLYLAGTRIRLYNGSPPASSDEAEYVALYAGHGTGTLSAGAVVRIKDADNESLHTRALFSDAAFNDLDSNIIRNQDGTRAFIFIKSAGAQFSELENGVYRLNFEFKRDIGVDAPILKRFGFSDPEKTAIEFSLPGSLPLPQLS
jgi:hypothetical protein